MTVIIFHIRVQIYINVKQIYSLKNSEIKIWLMIFLG